MATMDQNVMKVRTLYRNIFQQMGDGKYICKGIHNFMQNCPNEKDLQKWDTLEIHILSERKGKFEVAKKKNYFHNDTIIAAAFP
jgi:hypothetical protein